MKNLLLILLVILVVIYFTQKQENYSMLDSSIFYSSMLNNQPRQRLAWETFAVSDEGQSAMKMIILTALGDEDKNDTLIGIVKDWLNNRIPGQGAELMRTKAAGILDSAKDVRQKLQDGTAANEEMITKVRGIMADFSELNCNLNDVSCKARNIIDTFNNKVKELEHFGMLDTSVYYGSMLNNQPRPRIAWAQA
jgi:hypothetical protein